MRLSSKPLIWAFSGIPSLPGKFYKEVHTNKHIYGNLTLQSPGNAPAGTFSIVPENIPTTVPDNLLKYWFHLKLLVKNGSFTPRDLVVNSRPKSTRNIYLSACKITTDTLKGYWACLHEELSRIFPKGNFLETLTLYGTTKGGRIEQMGSIPWISKSLLLNHY